MRGGRSRNKVAVGEPAAGSPPIYFKFSNLYKDLKSNLILHFFPLKYYFK
jgi:hypothetical protein